MDHYDLNKIMGRVELSSRWVPCTCGDQWCGGFVNRTREIGRDGTVIRDTESPGVKTLCDGIPPKPKSWLSRLFNRSHLSIWRNRGEKS